MHARVQVHAGDAQRLTDAWLAAPDDVAVERLTAGCPCCLGQLPLRVTLVRLVRSLRPQALLLLLATEDHAARVKALLADGSLGVRFDVE